MQRGFFALLIAFTITAAADAQSVRQTTGDFEDKFRQLEEILPTPNMFRNAAGAPGPLYWQQSVDYRIRATLDDAKQTLTGSETITYANKSPDTLRYLWVQLDQNLFRADSIGSLTGTAREKGRLSYAGARIEFDRDFGGGYNITSVTDAAGQGLKFTVVGTMMRVDLPKALAPAQKMQFNIEWNFKIVDAKIQRARSGYEFFKDDGNYIYTMAQWFPRLAAYTDVDGWNNKQFIGNGEFTLEFGNYDVEITVPSDHIVAATGILQNPDDVLTAEQRQRLKTAEAAAAPVLIVSPDEALANETPHPDGTKTWAFKAENVRDFAFASSRKFIWDAQGYEQSDNSHVMAMSFYPKEGEPIWQKYSTQAIIHTMEVYSRYTFLYPYPLAQSVNGPVGGMEYPMISFNGPRTEKDDDDGTITYSQGAKYGLISVVIHEVGHNYFPMTVNSDERQWTWMDEGLNTFLEFIAEQEWEKGYPSNRGEPRDVIDYMKSPNQVPIMTQSDSILDLGNNAYAKPATALVILRETVLGRDLFDFAFKEFATRWKFKRPTPADFFRTMEDASGVDLDWFWRGWFYSTDHVDIALDMVDEYKIDTKNPDVEEPLKREEEKDEPLSLTQQRDENVVRRVDRFPELLDFYNENDRYTVTEKDRKSYKEMFDGLEDWEKEILAKTETFYMLELSNKGGLVMPVILGITYKDGSAEELRLPAEIWRTNPKAITKLLIREKEIAAIDVDPHWETADTDITNNSWPRKPVTSRLELFKMERFGPSRNLMKEMLVGSGKDKPDDAAKTPDGDVTKTGDKAENPDDAAPADGRASLNNADDKANGTTARD